MKRTLLSCLCLLAALMAGATKTSDSSVLRIDSLSFDGNSMEMMTQHLLLCGQNLSSSDFEGMLYVLRETADGNFERLGATVLTLEAEKHFSGVIACELPLGSYNVCVAADQEGRQMLGTRRVDIVPRRKLNFSVQFAIDMMGTADGENVLSGHRLQGQMTIRNNDNVPYYGVSPILSHSHGFMYHLKEAGDRLSLTGDLFIANELQPSKTITKDIAIDFDFEEGKRYALVLTYAQPTDVVAIDSLLFTFHAGTNTYWTADGTVKPMPIEGGQKLVVPREAVAVDLRGQYFMNTVFTIDDSQANPNCLYYLDFLDNVPQGLSATSNVVRDGQAAIVRLTDACDFYCPKAFKAKYISYTLQPTIAISDKAYAETLVLPFRPQGATLDAINADDENPHSHLLKIFRYYGYGQGPDGIDTLTIDNVNVRQMEAYVPYIVAVGVSTPVTFYAEEATVPVTSPAVVRADGLDFVGTTVFKAPSSAALYRYNPELGLFSAEESDDPLPPFRAWLVTSTSHMGTGDEDELGQTGGAGSGTGQTMGDLTYFLMINTGFDLGIEPTSVATPGVQALPTAVYSLSGIRQTTDRLPAGLYIANGKKMLVR